MHLRNISTVSIPTRLLVTFLLTAVIAGLSIVPGQAQHDNNVFSWLLIVTPTLLQKCLHVLNYAALAFLWAWTLERIGSQAARYVLAFAAAVALGVMLEWIQTTVSGRFGSFTDVLLNTLGVVMGLVLAHLCGPVEARS